MSSRVPNRKERSDWPRVCSVNLMASYSALSQKSPNIPLCRRGKNRQTVLVKIRHVHCKSLQATVLIEDMNIP